MEELWTERVFWTGWDRTRLLDREGGRDILRLKRTLAYLADLPQAWPNDAGLDGEAPQVHPSVQALLELP